MPREPLTDTPRWQLRLLGGFELSDGVTRRQRLPSRAVVLRHLPQAHMRFKLRGVTTQAARHHAHVQAIGHQHRLGRVDVVRFEHASQRRQGLAQPVAPDVQRHTWPQQLNQLLARMGTLRPQRHTRQQGRRRAAGQMGDLVAAAFQHQVAQQAQVPARCGGGGRGRRGQRRGHARSISVGLRARPRAARTPRPLRSGVGRKPGYGSADFVGNARSVLQQRISPESKSPVSIDRVNPTLRSSSFFRQTFVEALGLDDHGRQVEVAGANEPNGE